MVFILMKYTSSNWKKETEVITPKRPSQREIIKVVKTFWYELQSLECISKNVYLAI